MVGQGSRTDIVFIVFRCSFHARLELIGEVKCALRCSGILEAGNGVLSFDWLAAQASLVEIHMVGLDLGVRYVAVTLPLPFPLQALSYRAPFMH